MFLVLEIVPMKKSRTELLSKFIILIFLISLIYTLYYLNKDSVSKYTGEEKQISGIITNYEETSYGYRLTISGKENILVRVYEKIKFNLGDKIDVKGTLSVPNRNTNFYLFNYQNYLKSENIYWIMDSEKIKIRAGNKKIYDLKNNLIKHLNKFAASSYLKAFIIGDDSEISEEVTDSYRLNGISHLLAISGMQVTFLSAILLFIFNLISKRKGLNYLILLMFLIFYTFLTSFSPPIIRGVSLFILLTIKKFINIKVKIVYLLILTASIYLFYNPFIIYNIGFLFSFIISFYLLLFTNEISKIKGYIKKTFIISFICFLASLPILIINFHYINLLSPFINIIFVPLVTFIIYPLSLITAFIPALDNPFLNMCELLEDLSLFFSKFDNLIITLKHIDLVIFLIYYLLITLVIYNFFKQKYKLLILFFIVLIVHHNINYFDKNSYITFLDVQQGDSIFLKLPYNKGNILIDTGGKAPYGDYSYDYASNVIIPYLKAEGITALDYLIITHGDYDHMGESLNLVKNFKVRKVIFNHDGYNTLEKNLLEVLKKKNIKYTKNIQKINISNNTLYFLNNKIYDNENDNSNVIYVVINQKKLLLMGDAGKEVEKEILKKYNLKNIDILKVGHHGSNTSTSKSFVKEISPRYAVISVSENNVYGHPHKSVLKNLKNVIIYQTSKNGSIKFKIKHKLKIETVT